MTRWLRSGKPGARRRAKPKLFLQLFALVISCALIPVGFLAYGVTGERGKFALNSLVLTRPESGDFSWGPHDTPSSFLLESSVPSSYFARVADSLQSTAGRSPLPRLDLMKLLVEHLKQTSGEGGAIRGDLRSTHRAITETGRGYCADYIRSFLALTHALGIPTRHWGLGFDRLGGGHAFVEFYSDEVDDWVFLDPYFAFYVVSAGDRSPLSVQGFHATITSPELAAEVIPIGAGLFQFPSLQSVITYYTNSSDYFYLFWGNNVASRDSHPLIRSAGRHSRVLELLVAISVGYYPGVRPFPTGTPENDAAIVASESMRRVILLGIGLMVTGLLLTALQLFRIYVVYAQERKEDRTEWKSVGLASSRDIPWSHD
jgi:hypothetical protein